MEGASLISPLNYPLFANGIGHTQGRSLILIPIWTSVFFNFDKNLSFQAFGLFLYSLSFFFLYFLLILV